jgi:CopG family nickel-responsive transcriptional regulator
MSVERVGVSFEPELLQKFDTLIKKMGYTNRSEAIRDLVRKEIIESAVRQEDCEVIGTLTIMYDHHEGDILDKLIHLEHRHNEEISFTTHIHVDTCTCLEIIILRGNSKRVKQLADQVKSLKGVKHGDLSITTTSV